jgi:hypothetical protein
MAEGCGAAYCQPLHLNKKADHLSGSLPAQCSATRLTPSSSINDEAATMVLRYVVHPFYHRSEGRSVPNRARRCAEPRRR